MSIVASHVNEAEGHIPSKNVATFMVMIYLTAAPPGNPLNSV